MVNKPRNVISQRAVAALSGAAAASLGGWFLGLWFDLGAPCGGDGGAPYATPGSRAGQFCNSPLHAAVLWSPLIAYLLLLGIVQWRHWRRGRVWSLLVAPLLLVAAGIWLSAYLRGHMT